MKRLMIIAVTLGLLAGCSTQTMDEAKIEAHRRWNHTRAQVLWAVANEYMKMGQLNQARDKSLEALSLAPDYTEAQILLGKVYIEQGHYRAAVSVLEKVCHQWPKRAEPVYLLAVAYEKNGQLEQALTNYRKAYAMDKENLSAIRAAAEVLVQMGRVREAQLQVESYLHLASEDASMYELAGRLAMMQQEYRKAARYFGRACDLDWKNRLYSESLAKAQFFARQYDQAAETLQLLAGDQDEEAGAWVFTMLGDCLMAMGQPRKAMDAYRVATQKQPEAPGVWVNLGRAALAMNDAPRAILSAQQALSLQNGFLDATLLLGYALLRNGQVPQAVEVLAKAVSRHPRNGTLLCLLGRAYAADGRENLAARYYVAALKLEPDNEFARKLLARSGIAGKLSGLN